MVACRPSPVVGSSAHVMDTAANLHDWAVTVAPMLHSVMDCGAFYWRIAQWSGLEAPCYAPPVDPCTRLARRKSDMSQIVFSSDQLPESMDRARRFSLWRDLYCQQYGEL